MEVSGIITAIIIGLILGVVGRAIAPGKQDIPIWLTILVGIVAALLGTFIWQAISDRSDTAGIDWIELLIQLVLAVVGVIAVAGMYGRGRTNSRV
ncbi:MAG: GlsB/YeaQ/YmgE family stress response membrane protein [Nocardioidaceae bacterium]